MRYFEKGKIGRVITIHMSKGDLVLESIKDVIEKANIKYAVLVSGIGTTSRTVFHRVLTTGFPPEEDFITLDGPVELSAVQGLVIDGNPHFHFVFSTLDQTYSGHLEPGCVTLYLMEVVLVELLDYDLTREKDENGIAYVTEKK